VIHFNLDALADRIADKLRADLPDTHPAAQASPDLNPSELTVSYAWFALMIEIFIPKKSPSCVTKVKACSEQE
jgi:hypothetical protein